MEGTGKPTGMPLMTQKGDDGKRAADGVASLALPGIVVVECKS